MCSWLTPALKYGGWSIKQTIQCYSAIANHCRCSIMVDNTSNTSTLNPTTYSCAQQSIWTALIRDIPLQFRVKGSNICYHPIHPAIYFVTLHLPLGFDLFTPPTPLRCAPPSKISFQQLPPPPLPPQDFISG